MTDASIRPAAPLLTPARVKLLGLLAGLAVFAGVIAYAAQSGMIGRNDWIYKILVDPFESMWSLPDLLIQTLWEGFVGGVLYALIALGFVLIFKASGVFNFAQGIMVVFAALSLVGFYEILTLKLGLPPGFIAAMLALIGALGIMFLLAVAVERIVLKPLVNQPDIIMLMATVGLTYFLIGFGEYVFGGNPKVMITQQ